MLSSRPSPSTSMRSSSTSYGLRRVSRLYHPLFVFNQFGDLEQSARRAGNVHLAGSWKEAYNRANFM